MTMALPVSASDERFFLGVEKSATGRAWRDRLDDRGVARATTITQRLGTPELLARVLAGRDVEAEEAEAYLDPTDEKGVFKALDVKAVKPLPKPVTLAAIRAERRLEDMALVKYARLSVQPVSAQQWKIVCAMGGLKA